MLDLGISKLMVIGVVALVVIGPERLPRVARMVGTLMGRAQRYVNDIKAEVSREMELDELRRAKAGIEEAASTISQHARGIHDTVADNLRSHENAITDAWSSGSSVSPEENITGVALSESDSSSPSSWRPAAFNKPAKRKNWRVKRTAFPVWYKRASATRTYVQSGAARVARHRPANLRRPSQFF